MESLINSVEEFLCATGFDQTYWLAYSGGLDSHVLLDILVKLTARYPLLKLRAVYVNHGLSPQAETWGDHCAEVCANLTVDFNHYAINANSIPGESPEEIAREKRYALFATLLNTNDVLLTAHHQDDQAETVLLQLMRGAGPKGLAAMPTLKTFAQGFHGRPLLKITRAQIKKYAEQLQLTYIDDESNQNTAFSRNFLRHQIMPLLRERWPSVTKTLSRVAENCADAQDVLENWVKQQSGGMRGSSDHSLSIKKLLLLDPAEQRQVIRIWLQGLNFPIPSAEKLQQILTTMLLAREDKLPLVRFGNIELRRYRDELWAMQQLPQHDASQIYAWHTKKDLVINNIGRLQSVTTNQVGLHPDIDQVTVRFRQGGEIFQLPGRDCHHDLKKLFQTWGIPPWHRARIPLIYVEEQFAAIPGFYVAAPFATNNQAWLPILTE